MTDYNNWIKNSDQENQDGETRQDVVQAVVAANLCCPEQVCDAVLGVWEAGGDWRAELAQAIKNDADVAKQLGVQETEEESQEMKSYVLEMADSGEVCEGYFGSEIDAILWAESVLGARGHDREEIVTGDWDAKGQNDDGEQCYRMLFWANEDDSENDAGAKSIAQLCKVGN
jgi:hypothetical protein